MNEIAQEVLNRADVIGAWLILQLTEMTKAVTK